MADVLTESSMVRSVEKSGRTLRDISFEVDLNAAIGIRVLVWIPSAPVAISAAKLAIGLDVTKSEVN
jgi:hypothetical protein